MKAFSIVALFVVADAVPVNAQWMINGTPVSTASGDQHNTIIAPDGTGGAIVMWEDFRSGDKVYAQRINAIGVTLWTPDGVEVCPVSSMQWNPAIVPDGTGGAIVSWGDNRNGVPRVYLQRIDPNGGLLWNTDGIPASLVGWSGGGGMMVSDAAGGAIILWHDFRNGTQNADLYAQRVNGAGMIQWSPNGAPICTVARNQYSDSIDMDGAGGFIVGWMDERNAATNGDVFAQRINATGVPQWNSGGVAVAVIPNVQASPNIRRDGAGGAFLTWGDLRNGVHADVYMQRLDESGIPQWNAGGIPLAAKEGDQTGPLLIPDDAGGAIVFWTDYGESGNDLFAQRVNDLGAPQWGSEGVPMCTAPGSQYWATVASDGNGGIIATWTDYRFQESDIYAQRVNSSGTPLWNTNGIMVSVADRSQREAVICSDGNGGAIIAWDDYRNGPTSDVFALRVYPDGDVAAPVDLTRHAPSFTLRNNSPDPFADFTRIEFNLPAPSFVSLDVYDVTGRRVFTDRREEMPAGWQQIEFRGREDAGRPLPSGVYFYRVSTSAGSVSEKMVIAR